VCLYDYDDDGDDGVTIELARQCTARKRSGNV